MNTKCKTGLNNKQVIESRKKYGSNILTKKTKNTFISLMFESLGDPIIKILLIALIIKILFLFSESNIFETIGIAIAVFLAAFVSAISEYGSEKAFEKLNEEALIIKVKVIRNSKKILILSKEIVVGDIIVLESGDKCPSDSKILDGFLDVDESSLTGETKEKHKCVNDMVFMGSTICNGSALLEVIHIADKTYYGSIASLIQDKKIDSPLKTRLKKLAQTISMMGYIAAAIILISYMLNIYLSYGFKNTSDFFSHLMSGLTLSVAVVVMAVPEGLPMMITLVLSSNMKRMLKKNVLVRKLVGIEAAGSLNILLTDKTGTLTNGKLKCTSFISTSLVSFNTYEQITNNEYIYQSLIYNNQSFFNNNTIEGGNSTDKAILEFTGERDKNKYKILKTTPFNSNNKYSLIKTDYNNGTYFIKGAYEVVINKCDFILINNEKRVLLDKNKYNTYISKYTSSGYRVIAFAYSNNEESSYVLLGFLLIKDTIRESSYDAVSLIKKAGVDIVMVTGDSYDVAFNVASELKLINRGDLLLSSEEFNELSDIEVKKIINKIKVIYRSLPSDKNRLVRLFQEEDKIVGMTGDGVNDAPALRKADVGFSMGSGAEVAKETSDIVILDNDIKSIYIAILYGRTIFENIRKFIIFQLSVNVCALLLSIICPFIGIATPITVVQVLWINMVMDTFAGLAFAFEPPLKEYMEEKPKHKHENILTRYMINEIICSGLYSFIICIFFLKSNYISNIYIINGSNKHLLTAFFGLFIFLAIFNAFNARTKRKNIFSNIYKNKIFIIIISFISIIQIYLLYNGGDLFRTTGLTLYEFYIMIIISFSIIPFDILRKTLYKDKKRL